MKKIPVHTCTLDADKCEICGKEWHKSEKLPEDTTVECVYCDGTMRQPKNEVFFECLTCHYQLLIIPLGVKE